MDAFIYAASALSAAAVCPLLLQGHQVLTENLWQVFRSLLGFAFPLFAQQMYDALGYGGGNSLLAGLALVLLPFPVWLYYHGEALRARSKLTRQ